MHHGLVAALVAVVLVSGCPARTQSPAPAPKEPRPAVEQRQGGQSTPPTHEMKPPEMKPAPNEEQLRQTVAELLKQQGVAVEPGRPGLYPLALSKVPEGYTRLWGTVADMKFFLVAVNDSGEAMLVTEIGGVTVHPFMVSMDSTTDMIAVQSINTLGDTMEVELAWDGQSLTVKNRKVESAAGNYLTLKQKLIDAGDIDALMTFPIGDIPYLHNHAGYWSQPPQVLRLAYAKSLERYRAGDTALALRTLQFGVAEYRRLEEILSETVPDSLMYKEHVLPLAERIPIANDLAFFMAELQQYEQALPLLQAVVRLAPNRTVAYLNLADVEWELGQKAEARVHYQKYLDLLSPDGRPKAPERVRQRLND